MLETTAISDRARLQSWASRYGLPPSLIDALLDWYQRTVVELNLDDPEFDTNITPYWEAYLQNRDPFPREDAECVSRR